MKLELTVIDGQRRTQRHLRPMSSEPGRHHRVHWARLGWRRRTAAVYQAACVAFGLKFSTSLHGVCHPRWEGPAGCRCLWCRSAGTVPAWRRRKAGVLEEGTGRRWTERGIDDGGWTTTCCGDVAEPWTVRCHASGLLRLTHDGTRPRLERRRWPRSTPSRRRRRHHCRWSWRPAARWRRDRRAPAPAMTSNEQRQWSATETWS